MSRVVSFFCDRKQSSLECMEQTLLCMFARLAKYMMNSLAFSPFRISITHIVFQALDDLDAIVAQIELSQVAEALQTFNFSDPVTLQRNVHNTIKQCFQGTHFHFSACNHSGKC